MADVNQSYNIDTTQAIASMRALDGTISKFNSGVKRLSKTSKAVQSVTVSWQTLGRVIATQAIVRGLSEATRLFREAAEAAEEFQITLARIQGISDIGSIEALRDQLGDIATSAGRDLNEVAGAALEAFQNDLGTVDETIKLLSGSIRDLAVVTDSDFQSAVNTISPLIKTYNLDAEEAARVSGILFQTIDSGVVQLEDLEGRLGGVSKLAADLKVPIEEVFSAIATGTLAGNDTATSMTQLRNVLIKLTKPTQELRNAFNELGVETFVELQETGLTLRESLDAIFDALDQDPERFARAFNTIRATLGATNIRLREGADNASVFDRVLGEMAGSSESLSSALERIEETDAFKSRENAAQFSEILKEIGDDVLSVKNLFVDTALIIFNDSRKIETALTGVASAAGLYSLSLLGVKSALSFIPPVAVATASGLATLWVTDEIDAYSERLSQLRDDLGRINSEEFTLEIIEDQEKEKLEDLVDTFNDVESAINSLVENNDRVLDDLSDRLFESSELLADLAVNTVESFGDSRSRLLGQVERDIDNLDKTVAENLRDLSDARAELADFNFQRGLEGLSEGARFAKIQEEAFRRLAVAREKIAQVGFSDESVEAAQAANEEAEAIAQTLRRSAEKLGVQQQINEAVAFEAAVLSNNVAIFERQEEALKNTNVKELRKGLIELTRLNADQQEDLKEIQELYSLTNADGTSKSVKTLRDDVIDARRKTEELKESFEDFADADILDTVGIEEAARNAQEALIDGLSQIDVDYSESIDEFERDFESRTFQANIEFENAALREAAGVPDVEEAIQGAQAEGLGDRLKTTELIRDALQGLIADQQEFASQSRIAAQELEVANAKIAQGLTQLREDSIFENVTTMENAEPLIRFIEGVSASFDTLGVEGMNRLQASIRAKIPEIRELLDQGLISESRAKVLETTYNNTIDAIFARIRKLQSEALAAPENAEAAERALEATREIEQSVIEPQVDDGQVRQMEASVDDVKQSGIEASTSVSTIGTAAGNANGFVSSLSSTTGSLSGRANSAAQAFRNMESAAKAAIAAAKEANSLGNAQNAFRGGHIRYRAGGGDVRGQDTVPAMLSPGEFVVNARQSRNFFSQLQAINAGAASGTSGGDTTNINIGDVNVTTPTNVPNDTAREIGQSIKRELRRRTFTL